MHIDNSALQTAVLMHILHINDSLERGGAETLLVNTVQALAQLYPEVKQTVVTLYDKGELTELLKESANYYSLNLKKAFPLHAILKLRKIIKRENVQVVHSHLLHSTFIARMALPKNVGLVSTYHSVFYEPSMVAYARKELFIDRLTYRKKYFSVFVSEAVQSNIAQSVGISENQKVLRNFASSKFKPQYHFRPENLLKIVMVGNLHEIKNHAIAVQALGHLSHLPIQLDIYGEGNLREYLQDLIHRLKANVFLKGAQIITSELLSQYDLYMMTSLHEGMPISLLEAMQTGLPSLLNDVAMLQETAGNAAFFYEYNNLNNLVQRINDIYDNKVVLQQLSKNALARSQNFSADTFIHNLMAIYNQVCCFVRG